MTDNGTTVSFGRYITINAIGSLGQSIECSGDIYSAAEIKTSNNFVNNMTGTGLYNSAAGFSFFQGLNTWVSNTAITATAFYEGSDIRYKNVLETNPKVDLLGIDVIKFTRTDDETEKVRFGYSAQQVQEILPEAVTGEDKLSVNYMDVHTLKIAALEKRIAELEAKLNK